MLVVRRASLQALPRATGPRLPERQVRVLVHYQEESVRQARQLRIEWWRHLVPKIGHCRSALLGVPCSLRRWHLGWHKSEDIGWQRRGGSEVWRPPLSWCTTRRDQ